MTTFSRLAVVGERVPSEHHKNLAAKWLALQFPENSYGWWTKVSTDVFGLLLFVVKGCDREDDTCIVSMNIIRVLCTTRISFTWILFRQLYAETRNTNDIMYNIWQFFRTWIRNRSKILAQGIPWNSFVNGIAIYHFVLSFFRRAVLTPFKLTWKK